MLTRRLPALPGETVLATLSARYARAPAAWALVIAAAALHREEFAALPPLLLAGRGGDVIYAWDLHAHDSLLVHRYPDRALYLLRPASAHYGAPAQFHRLDRDSALAVWRGVR